MRPIPTETSEPIRLTPEQIQHLYLEIQGKLGILIAAVGAPPGTRVVLQNVSTLLFKTKRKWIGVRDELKGAEQ